MRTIPSPSFLAAVVLISFAGALCAQGTERLTFEDTRKALQWQGRVPSARWAPDGVHVELEDKKVVVWLDPATGERKPKPDGSAAAPPLVGGKTLFLIDGDLWFGERDAPTGPAATAGRVRLTSDGSTAGKIEEPQLSPDHKSVAFVRGNNLYVVDTAAQTQWAVTEDGGPELFHGLLDWVYQEELYGRGDFQGHWWSPTGAALAFLSLDEAPVREFTVVDHVPEGFLDSERAVKAEVTNYPKAGDPNPNARLSIAHLGDRRIVPVDLSSFPADVLVVRVDWTPDGAHLLATIQDRIQTWAELCAVDPTTGAVTRWIREESPTWVNRPEPPVWLDDGTFLWLSERTGYEHVYRYERGGKRIGPVTEGEWQFRNYHRVDKERQVLWFEGTKDGATGRHLYRVGFDGTGLTCVTPGIGTHAFALNEAGTFVLDRWSALDRPTTVRVLDARDGRVVAELGQADKGPAAAQYAFSERQRVTIAARDGYELDACVQLPPDWQEGARYPVFLPTYSGPDAPSVRDTWSPSSYHQFLAQQGFVILQVNVRSASGRGQRHTGTCYRQLGVQELEDLEDAVDHVCARFGGDPQRVAISGWSYGGFMAAYALTHSKKFALGLAGAGVYDWRLYDTIYTERYMRTPQENAAGYDATSVIKAAKDLHGHLVILHGTMDDNVHLQGAMQLVWALQAAGVQDFELMLYPRSRHGPNPQLRAFDAEFQWLRLKTLLGTPGGR